MSTYHNVHCIVVLLQTDTNHDAERIDLALENSNISKSTMENNNVSQSLQQRVHQLEKISPERRGDA